MNLPTLSDRHGGFFVPAFVVLVGGSDLVREEAIGVTQVEVDLSLNKAGQFRFTVSNTFDLESHEFRSGHDKFVFEIIKFGAPVEIKMGYGDHKRLPTILRGTIKEISTSFSEGASPEISVSGMDAAFKMTLGKKSNNWEKAKDSDVVREIAARNHNLAIDIEDSQVEHPRIEQHQESDFEFIRKLAARNHFEVYVDEEQKLRFGKPNDKSATVLTLKWGEGLLSFKPEGNLAEQVSSVEVLSYDPKTKKFIVGRAKGDESGRDPTRQSAGERLPSIANTVPPLQIRQPTHSQAEANTRAKAILNTKAKKFLTGEGETLGARSSFAV